MKRSAWLLATFSWLTIFLFTRDKNDRRDAAGSSKSSAGHHLNDSLSCGGFPCLKTELTSKTY